MSITIRDAVGPLQLEIILSAEGFVERLKELIPDRQQLKDIPRQQLHLRTPTLERLLPTNDSKASRDHLFTHVEYGCTLKEIGDELKIHYCAASKVIFDYFEKSWRVKSGFQDLISSI